MIQNCCIAATLLYYYLIETKHTKGHDMTNLIFKGFTEIDQPAQFITVVLKHGFEIITGYYAAAKGLNVDGLVIGQVYQMNTMNNEVTL